MDFKGATGTSKCVACHHPPTSHPLSPQTHGAGRDKRTSPTPTAHHGVDSEFSANVFTELPHFLLARMLPHQTIYPLLYGTVRLVRMSMIYY